MEAWRNMAVRKRRNLDMTHGPLLGKILLFSVPVMLTSLLQVAFNAADVIVVGQFAGYSSLAAVGSSTSTIFLFINMLVGISVGVNVLIANYVGAGDKDREISHALHNTAATVARSRRSYHGERCHHLHSLRLALDEYTAGCL